MSAPTPPTRRTRRAAILLLCAAALQLAYVAPAAAGASGQITLLGQLTLNGAAGPDDVWGWVDPQTQKEYALVADYVLSLTIVDVSDPTNPTVASSINVGPAFDIKTWGHYAYVVDAALTVGAIVDISDPLNPAAVGSFPPSHNIWIDNRGFMYKSKQGIAIMNLAPDPTVPYLVWADSASCGHDCFVEGNRLYDFHCSRTDIYEVGNPWAPVLLGTIRDTSIAYHHSGWTSEDRNHLFINDEQAYSPHADFTVWNIEDPSNAFKVGEYNDPDATIHNAYRRGGFLLTSYYREGFQVFDVVDPANPCFVAQYDTSVLTGEGSFDGLFGIYPFAPSGNIYGSDFTNGLYIFSFTAEPTAVPDGTPRGFALRQNYPNPFNPTTTIAYDLDAATRVTLNVFDTGGRRVRTLVDQAQGAGRQSVQWDGLDSAGRRVASGVYFYRLDAAGRAETRRMILLK